ncbi:hypothetical protein WA556_000857 [Blastocystis sp. ATCC 50177/Nand II]
MSRENARSRRGNPYLNSASRESVRPSSSSSTLFHSANDTSATRKKGQFGGVEESMHQRTGAKRNNNSLSLVLDVPRELLEDEVKLIREVASAMDPAIALSCEKRGESSTVTIAYNRSAPIRFINALKALIFGICKTYNSSNMPLTEPAAIGNTTPPFEEARKVDLFTAAQAPTPQQLQSLQKAPSLQSLQKAPTEKQELSPVDDEEGEETPGQFERPMSLKGQRHVFLYKCRYSQLKSIIDHCGCWGLRMASLQEKWPCLVV